MGVRDVPLNPAQLEVLAWVRDGCQADVYQDWSHRITARALDNRGLVTVKGHGGAWTAKLTEDGRYYLSNGSYPPREPPAIDAKPQKTAVTRAAPAEKRPERPRPERPAQSAREPKARKTGPVDQMMTALNDSVEHQILVPARDEARYRQLSAAAKRFGRIADGMQLTFARTWDGGASMLRIALEPLPAWQTAILQPLPVSARLREPADVVRDLMESETFPVTGDPRKRALRLLDALVTGARERDMTVTALLNQPIRRDSYASGGPHRDEVRFAIGEDEFRIWFTQATLHKPHEPTDREIARARRGYLFPDTDDVPDEHLGITLEGHGGTFWGSKWADTDEHRLEEDLAQILEEIRLRHESLIRQREEAREHEAQQEREWEAARERAVVRYRRQFLIDAMHAQSAKWEQASGLRRYAEAIRAEGQHLEGEARDQAMEWAAQIEAQAELADPLPAAAKVPEIPEPSPEQLKPFMGSWSAYGPHR
jgi:hypothetical protein